jgi:hypothetical protein
MLDMQFLTIKPLFSLPNQPTSLLSSKLRRYRYSSPNTPHIHFLEELASSFISNCYTTKLGGYHKSTVL